MSFPREVALGTLASQVLADLVSYEFVSIYNCSLKFLTALTSQRWAFIYRLLFQERGSVKI